MSEIRAIVENLRDAHLLSIMISNESLESIIFEALKEASIIYYSEIKCNPYLGDSYDYTANVVPFKKK